MPPMHCTPQRWCPLGAVLLVMIFLYSGMASLCKCTCQLAPSPLQVAEDGKLVLHDGHTSCHELRQALQAFPAELPLVVYSSVGSLSTATMRSLLDYFLAAPGSLLEPYSSQLRASQSIGNPAAATTRCRHRRTMWQQHCNLRFSC